MDQDQAEARLLSRLEDRYHRGGHHQSSTMAMEWLPCTEEERGNCEAEAEECGEDVSCTTLPVCVLN